MSPSRRTRRSHILLSPYVLRLSSDIHQTYSFSNMESLETFRGEDERYIVETDGRSYSRLPPAKERTPIYRMGLGKTNVANPFTPGKNTLSPPHRPLGVEEMAAQTTMKKARRAERVSERDAGPSQAGPSRAQVVSSRKPLHSIDRDMTDADWRKSGRPASALPTVKSPPKTPAQLSRRSKAGSSTASHSNPVEIMDSDEEEDIPRRTSTSPRKTADQHLPTRSSAFGTHAKRTHIGSSGPRPGVEHPRSSRSPVKGSHTPARAPILHLHPELKVPDEEVERIEQEQPDEAIENPDGHWQGDDGIHVIETPSSPKRPATMQQRRASPSKWIDLDTEARPNRTAGKQGKDPPSKGRAPDSTVVQSSRLQKGPLVAKVEKAWNIPAPRLGLESVHFAPAQGDFVLFGSKPESFCRLKILDSAKTVRVCMDSACPFLSMEVNLAHQKKQRDDFGQLTIPMTDGSQHESPHIHIAFSSGSMEAVRMLETICTYLKSRNGPVEIINKSAVDAILGTCPEEDRGRDTRVRAMKAREKQRDLSRQDVDTTRRQRQSDTRSTVPSKESKLLKKKDQPEQDPTQSKLDFFRRRSNRLSGAPPVEYEVGEGVHQSGSMPVPKPGLSAAQRNELLFPYPFFLRPDLNVTKGDRYRVESHDFLNDVLIEFGLKHLLYGNAPEERHRNADRIHMFNSFFFTKIATRKGLLLDECVWPAYNSVRRWTRNANIFDKDLVVVPINEAYHWYLAVIYNPKGILIGRPPSDILEEADRDVSPPLDAVNVDGSNVDKTTIRSNSHGDDAFLNELMAEAAEDTAVAGAAHLRSEDSIDPLDIIDQTDGDIRMSARGRSERSESEVEIEAGMSEGVSRMSLDVNDNKGHDLKADDASSDAPPLVSDTLSKYQEQYRRGGSNSESRGSGSPTRKQKSAVRVDADILGSNECWIMTFDSLGSAHKAAHTHLNRWLKFEARDKLGKDITALSDAKYWEATVPQQPNFSDCGLFLVHYAKQILDRPEEMIGFIQQRPPPANDHDGRQAYNAELARVWQADLSRSFRVEWTNTIDALSALYASQKDLTVAPPAHPPETSTKSPSGDGELSQDSIQIASQPIAEVAPTNGVVISGEDVQGGNADPAQTIEQEGLMEDVQGKPLPSQADPNVTTAADRLEVDPRLLGDRSPAKLEHLSAQVDDVEFSTEQFHAELSDRRHLSDRSEYGEEERSSSAETKSNEAGQGEDGDTDLELDQRQLGGQTSQRAQAEVEQDELVDSDQEEDESRFASDHFDGMQRSNFRGTILPESPHPHQEVEHQSIQVKPSGFLRNDDDADMISDSDEAQSVGHSDPLTALPPSSPPVIDYRDPGSSRRAHVAGSDALCVQQTIRDGHDSQSSSPFTNFSHIVPGDRRREPHRSSPERLVRSSKLPSPVPSNTVQSSTRRPLVPASSDVSSSPEETRHQAEDVAPVPRDDLGVTAQTSVGTSEFRTGPIPGSSGPQRTYGRRGRRVGAGLKRPSVRSPESVKVTKKAKGTVRQGETAEAAIEIEDEDQ